MNSAYIAVSCFKQDVQRRGAFQLLLKQLYIALLYLCIVKVIHNMVYEQRIHISYSIPTLETTRPLVARCVSAIAETT